MSTIRLTADVSLQAAKGEQPATIKILAYGGDIMNVPGWGPLAIDLNALELGENIPLLLDHQNAIESVAGSGTPRIENGQLFIDGQIARETQAGQSIIALSKAGVKLGASVGVEPIRTERLDAGGTMSLNGRTIKAGRGGLTITRAGRLRETSLCPCGADPSAGVLSIAAKLNRGNQMSKNLPFDQWADSLGLDRSLMTGNQLAGLHANYHGRSEAIDADHLAVSPMILASAPADPVEGEQKRLRQINAACAGDWQEHAEQVAKLKASAVGGELTVDDLLSELRQVRRQKMEATTPAYFAAGRSSRDSQSTVIEAALCLAGGLSKPQEHFPEQVLDAADRMVRGTSLQTMLMQAACGNGYTARPGEYVTDGNLRQILQAAFAPAIRAQGWSTLNISNVTANVANKFLLDGFAEVEDPWQSIATVKTVRNFKEHTFVRLLDSLEFEELAPAGEIKHGTLGDDTMTVRAATYARMLSITRTDIINDDTSALTDAPRRLGRAAAMKFRRLFWSAFLAADSFFDASNGNVLTGAGTELDLDGVGLTAALKAFRAQKSPDKDGGKLIGGRPSVLMVPPALEVVARRLLTSTGIVSGAEAMTPNANPFAGLATLVVADWIGTEADPVNGDDNKWYLLRAPSFAPAMLVAALNGRVEPTIETSEADFNTLGIQMRGYNDVGFARGEKLCGLQMEGTPAGE